MSRQNGDFGRRGIQPVPEANSGLPVSALSLAICRPRSLSNTEVTMPGFVAGSSRGPACSRIC